MINEIVEASGSRDQRGSFGKLILIAPSDDPTASVSTAGLR